MPADPPHRSHRRGLRYGLPTAPLLILATGVQAEPYGYFDPARQAGEEAVAEPFAGEAALDLADVSGNTESRALAADLALVWEQQRWRERARATAVNEQSSGEATAERYTASGQVDYKLPPAGYLFLLSEYESDRFSGYDYRANAAAGYGRRLLDTDSLTLDAEAGPGYRFSRLEPGRDDDGAADGGEVTARGTLRLEWAITETASLRQDLVVEAGDEATITTSSTRIRSELLDPMSVQIGYQLRNVSETPEDVESTDTRFTVGIAYEF